MELSDPPPCFEVEYQTLLTSEALMFVVELVRQFDKNVEQVYIIIIIMISVQFICVFCQPRDTVFYISICISDKTCMDNFAFKTGFTV